MSAAFLGIGCAITTAGVAAGIFNTVTGSLTTALRVLIPCLANCTGSLSLMSAGLQSVNAGLLSLLANPVTIVFTSIAAAIAAIVYHFARLEKLNNELDGTSKQLADIKSRLLSLSVQNAAKPTGEGLEAEAENAIPPRVDNVKSPAGAAEICRPCGALYYLNF